MKKKSSYYRGIVNSGLWSLDLMANLKCRRYNFVSEDCPLHGIFEGLGSLMSGRPFNEAPQLEWSLEFFVDLLLTAYSIFILQSAAILRVKSPESLCLGLLDLHLTSSPKISPYYYYFSGKVGFQCGHTVTLQELCLTSSPYRFTKTVHLSPNERMSWTALHGARSRMKSMHAQGTHFHIRQMGCWQSKRAYSIAVLSRWMFQIPVFLNSALSLSGPRFGSPNG
jgi:hypothetical protein